MLLGSGHSTTEFDQDDSSYNSETESEIIEQISV